MIISQSNDIHGYDNFPMGCAFSPDGTCILTATASDGKFRLYDTPFQYLSDNGNIINKGVSDDSNCIKDNNNQDGGDDDKADDDAVNRVNISTTTAAHHSAQQKHKDTAAESTAAYSHNQNQQSTSNQQTHTDQQQQSNTNDQPSSSSSYHPWSASLTSHQGGPSPSSSSASYTWYPLMTSNSPLTSLYATCRGHSMPIHLIDAYTSQIRASYRPYNNVDEMEGPTVVQFSPDGRRIYGTGFKSDRTIAVFDTSVPGREGMIARLGKTRRSSDGQKGIPSSLAFPKYKSSGDGSGSDGPTNVFAVGTYSPASIYIYDDRMASNFTPAGTIVLHGGLTVVGHGRAFTRKKRRFNQVGSNNNQDNAEDSNDANLFSSARVNWFQSRARGGITQLMWAPPTSNNPYVLFSASRRSNNILSWDIRCLSGQDSNGNQPICGLQSYARDGDTNQRLEFDLDEYGRRMFVGSGCSEGVVKIYDVTSGALEETLDVAVDGKKKKDAVNGISYFPSQAGNSPLLAVAVGCRQYDDQESDTSDGEDGSGADKGTPGLLQLHILNK